MLSIYFKNIKEQTFSKQKKPIPGSWIHIENAEIKDLEQISKITNLEIQDLKDSLDIHEIPRIEKKENNIIIFARNIEEGQDLQTVTITIILTKKYIITIAPKKSTLINSILNSNAQISTTQKSKLLIFFLLKITQEFTSKIKLINNAVIEQEKKIRNIDNKAILKLTKNKEKLNQYLSSLVPMKSVIESIASKRFVTLYEKDYDLLEDLQIALSQSENFCRVIIKSISSLRDAYQIIFTNDLNKIIKLLTAITIIFTIPTIIASLYGMNVKLPLASHANAFSIIIISTTVFCIGSIFFFIKKKWL